jgi:hypothetical protein
MWTDRQTDKNRQRQRDKKTKIDKDRQRQTKTDGQRQTDKDRQTDKKTDKNKDRQAKTDKDRQTKADRQRQTDRQKREITKLIVALRNFANASNNTSMNEVLNLQQGVAAYRIVTSRGAVPRSCFLFSYSIFHVYFHWVVLRELTL